MTTFKAVNGFTTKHHIIPDPTDRHPQYDVFVRPPWPDSNLPCTIIPGHWAERIESGELLSKGEWCALKEEYKEENSYADDSTMAWDEYLIRAIARKLRGEA